MLTLPHWRMRISLRLASFARGVASFASYSRAFLGQNEIVAGSRETRRRWAKIAECHKGKPKMNEIETTAPVRAFDRAYINGKFVTPHGTQVVDLVNPTNNTVIGKVTMADEIDTRQAIAAAKEAFNTFSQSGKEYRMDCLQRLHDAVAKRMDQLVDATVLEYGAPQDRAKGSNNLAANIFLHFKEVLKDFDLARTVGTSKVVMEPAGVVGSI